MDTAHNDLDGTDFPCVAGIVDGCRRRRSKSVAAAAAVVVVGGDGDDGERSCTIECLAGRVVHNEASWSHFSGSRAVAGESTASGSASLQCFPGCSLSSISSACSGTKS